MVAPSVSAPALSYADRAKKNIRPRPTDADPIPQQQPQSSPQKQPPVNVWLKRKEEFAARHKSAADAPAPQPSASTSSSSENLSQNDTVDPSSDRNDDDDPFVVRSSRAPRQHVPLPSADSTDDWPQVGKSIPSSTSAETTKAEDSRIESRKGGAPKWVPLPIQAPADVQHRDPHPSIANRQSTNSSGHSSSYGHGRNSRNHSGRNSANQSASHSRIHSNTGSAHSSPRYSRSKRLPNEDLNGAPTNRTSRGPSPLPQNFPSFPSADITAPGSNYGAFLSPPHGPAPYYPQQPPNLPPVGSPIYQSPSHPQQSLALPDPSLPMPSVHGYPYVPYFPGYDYGQPPAPYSYWNGHHSHPASGQQSPAYPPTATPSTYLPMHVQQHFYPPPQIQPSIPQSSSTSERSSAGRLSPVTGLDVTTSVPLLDTDSKINGELKRSTSVIFGTIDDTVQSSATIAEVESNNNLEKGFKLLAIGINATESIKPRKSNKLIKNDGGEKDDHRHHHHQHTKIVNGDIALDPLLAKKAESGETRWKFGNEGLVSPAGGPAIDIETKVATEDSQVCAPTGKGKTTAKEGEGEERVETSRFQPPREGGGGRGRRGSYIDRGFPRRGRGTNGFNRGYNRGFGRGGGGGPHQHGGNSYQQRQGPPPSYNVPPPLPFQSVPSSHPMEGNYYNGPPGTPLATYIPTGYDPYAPTQQQSPSTPVQSFSVPGTAAGPASPPMPMPSTPITFPLDPTRYYLLGQLEYYLSPQNMAQDLFLRRHMDSRGWISIGLLASFNRVKRLTQEHQLVHEALMYSSSIQVKDDFARMSGWEQFVLPDAPRSMVEGEENPPSSTYIPQFSYPHPHHVHDASGVIPLGEEQQQQQRWSNSNNHNHNNKGGGDGEVDEEVDEDEDEDDVVFVMGEHDVEGKGMWSHEKRT